MHACKHAHAHKHTHTHTHAQPHEQTQIHNTLLNLACMCTSMHTCTKGSTHTCMYPPANPLPLTQMHAPAQNSLFSDNSGEIQKAMSLYHANTQPQTHTQTHTHPHTNARTSSHRLFSENSGEIQKAMSLKHAG
jgi:hypothetical protein